MIQPTEHDAWRDFLGPKGGYPWIGQTTMTVPCSGYYSSWIESSRDIVQDFLVPELKAVKVSVESLEREVKFSIDSLRQEIRVNVDSLTHQIDSLRAENKLRDEKLDQLIRSSLEKMEILIRTGDEKNAIAIGNLAERLEFREQLASIEARLPRQ